MAAKPSKDISTRLLNIGNVQSAPLKRGTGPLDYLLPWVIELRVTGTAEVIPVQIQKSIIIGRSDRRTFFTPDVDLEPHGAYTKGVSRLHAMISARNSRVTLCDQSSANGTYLNGGRLEPGREYRLMHGDIVSLGQLQLQVVFVLMPSSYEKHETMYRDVQIPVIGTGQRVLVTEEDNHVAQTISSVLEQAGFSVTTTTCIDDALLAAQEEIPQAIVTELMLGDRNGLDLIQQLRDLAGYQGLPVVVVTSASGGYQMSRAREAGINIFLTKPVGVDELLNSVAGILPQMQT